MRKLMAGNASLGLLGTLGVVFVVLKLCAVIDWSWWLVLAPLYVGLAIVLVLFAIAVLVVWRLAHG